MDYSHFEAWFSKLADEDKEYLEKHKEWKKRHAQALKEGKLPDGFIEWTMEILEDGSESET